MPIMQSRKPYIGNFHIRPKRPETDKIIFLSCEGCVTEEQYFDFISQIYDSIKSKIQFVSVSEDAVNTHHKFRTTEQNQELGKTSPKQLVERIEAFKSQRNDDFQFDKHLDDEFWIVTDVDNNLSKNKKTKESTFIEEWNVAIRMCIEKGYGYAISNPFFELWLLLHHSEVTDDEKYFAVTEEHDYETTDHFREILRKLGYPMKKQKRISQEYYTDENVRLAIERAKKLHIDHQDMQPKYLATTVYLLLEKIISLI